MVSQLRLPASKVLLKPEHVSKGFQRGKLGKTRQNSAKRKKKKEKRKWPTVAKSDLTNMPKCMLTTELFRTYLFE